MNASSLSAANEKLVAALNPGLRALALRGVPRSYKKHSVIINEGEIKHDGGVVTDSPGLYRIGLTFLRRRKSSFIHGAEDDAVDLTEHLDRYLKGH